MKVTEKEALAVRCPTCGAKPGEKCDLSTLACHEQNRIKTAV